MSAAPVKLPEFRWYSTGEFARLYHRHRRTVSRWCRNGTLEDFGFARFYVPRGRRSYWWVGVPEGAELDNEE